MKSSSCLIVQLLVGIALSTIPLEVLGFSNSPSSASLEVWLGTSRLFAIPLCFLALKMAKSLLISVGQVVWGVFSAFSGILLIFQIDRAAPLISFEGGGLLGLWLVASLALTFFSVQGLMTRTTKPK